jgi:hypothetical protein
MSKNLNLLTWECESLINRSISFKTSYVTYKCTDAIAKKLTINC